MDAPPRTPPELLKYWIAEREAVRFGKESGFPKPWSSDPIFQSVYFCNVHREHDRTTKYIREKYSPHAHHPWLIYNLILARFINRAESLKHLEFLEDHGASALEDTLEMVAALEGQLWSGAYIITTHGLPMGKVAYLVNHVLQGASGLASSVGSRGHVQGWRPTLAAYHGQLMQLEGLGSFLAAQIVADLKNTRGHTLRDAPDWYDFVAHGPGSLRGASWFHYGEIGKVTPATFYEHFMAIRDYLEWDFCNQDLQNCLCEFDKYMRVRSGTGKSKRKYHGLSMGA